jgi:hypothetical protein
MKWYKITLSKYTFYFCVAEDEKVWKIIQYVN